MCNWLTLTLLLSTKLTTLLRLEAAEIFLTNFLENVLIFVYTQLIYSMDIFYLKCHSIRQYNNQTTATQFQQMPTNEFPQLWESTRFILISFSICLTDSFCEMNKKQSMFT